MNDGLPERPRVTLRPELADAARRACEIPVEEQRRAPRVDSASRSTTATVTVPTWRARDVTREVDLVEEVVRFRIEDVPSTLPIVRRSPAQLTREQRLRRQVEDVLVGAGFHEAYTWTLVPEGGSARFRSTSRYTAELAALRDDARARARRVGAAEPSTPATSASRSSRSRASTCRPATCSRRSAGTSRGSSTAASRARRARSRRSRPLEPRFERAAARPDGGTHCEARSRADPDCSRAWGYFELDLDALFAAGAGARALRGRDHVSGRQAGPRVRRRRGRHGRRARRSGSARPPARAARDARLRRLPWRAGRARARSRSRSPSASSRRSARSRTRTRRELRRRIVEALEERFGAVLRA